MQSIANESNARWVWGASKVRGNAYLVGRPALERPVHLAVVGVEDVPVRPLAPTHVARDGRALVRVRVRARVRARIRVRVRARARVRARPARRLARRWAPAPPRRPPGARAARPAGACR